MSKNKNLIGGILVLVFASLALVACSPAQVSPTVNPEEIYTQAAETVQVGLTQTAAALPSATPTVTPQPTATLEPTPLLPPTLDVTSTNAIQPSPTQPRTADRAELSNQTPLDGTSMFPDQAFQLVWTLKNVGTTTWTTSYQVRFFLGDATLRFGAADTRFPKEVKPGETLDLIFSMKAPNRAGDFNTIWVLTNAEGANFFPLNLNIKVAGTAPTMTRTPEPEPTATETTTPTTEVTP